MQDIGERSKDRNSKNFYYNGQQRYEMVLEKGVRSRGFLVFCLFRHGENYSMFLCEWESSGKQGKFGAAKREGRIAGEISVSGEMGGNTAHKWTVGLYREARTVPLLH